RAGSLLSRDERIEILLMHGRRSRGSDGSARLERPHFVSAPDEAATEAAADPEQRQEDVAQDKAASDRRLRCHPAARASAASAPYHAAAPARPLPNGSPSAATTYAAAMSGPRLPAKISSA